MEYLYGGMNTQWGALRAADGHPSPYPAVAIEISNEACMDRFNGIYNATVTYTPDFVACHSRRIIIVV